MIHHLRKILRPVLILIVAIGPLQAQTVFACSMIEQVMTQCCCEDHRTDKDCADTSCDAAIESSAGPCCERSVEVSVDEDSREDTPFVLTLRFDLDPPQTITAAFTSMSVPRGNATVTAVQAPFSAYRSGSDTYLLTQRLRI